MTSSACPSLAEFVCTHFIAFFASAEELIASPTVKAVLIASLDPIHAGFVLEALRHQKYILGEKPLAQTAADCGKIINAECRCKKRFV